jgi:hypothetical protein
VEGDTDQSNGFFCLRPQGRFWPNLASEVASSKVSFMMRYLSFELPNFKCLERPVLAAFSHTSTEAGRGQATASCATDLRGARIKT